MGNAASVVASLGADGGLFMLCLFVISCYVQVWLAAHGNTTKVATMLNSIYGRLSLLLVGANARAFLARSISEATTMDLLGG